MALSKCVSTLAVPPVVIHNSIDIVDTILRRQMSAPWPRWLRRVTVKFRLANHKIESSSLSGAVAFLPFPAFSTVFMLGLRAPTLFTYLPLWLRYF